MDAEISGKLVPSVGESPTPNLSVYIIPSHILLLYMHALTLTRSS